MRRDVEESFLGAKIFYFSTVAIILGIFVTLKNPLRDDIIEGNYIHLIIVVILNAISSYLLLTAGKDPGFLEDTEQLMYEMNSPKKQDSDIGLVEEFEKRSDNSSLVSKGDLRSNSSNGSFPPERRFCEICRSFQPYRTKHCIKCERCVLKYDHHCFWIGKSF